MPANWDKRIPPPGQLIERQYKGKRLIVMVMTDGFEFEVMSLFIRLIHRDRQQFVIDRVQFRRGGDPNELAYRSLLGYPDSPTVLRSSTT